MKLTARTTWLGIIIGLLASSVIANMFVLFVYAGSPSEALEEDWEARAADWDRIQQQRILNRKLGWKIEAVAWERSPSPEAQTQDESNPILSQAWLSLRDASGTPLNGAQLDWKAFVRARPDQIQGGQALASEEAGQYRIDLPFSADRTLEFQVIVQVNDQRFTHTWIEDPKLFP